MLGSAQHGEDKARQRTHTLEADLKNQTNLHNITPRTIFCGLATNPKVYIRYALSTVALVSTCINLTAPILSSLVAPLGSA